MPRESSRARVLGPASFLATSVSAKSFGLIYCNPPFGHELGGGKRDEQKFAEQCARLLHPKGTLIMVIPINSIAGNSSFVAFLDSRFQDIAVYRFPDHCRDHHEIVLFCKPRVAAIPDDMLYQLGSLHKLGWRYGGRSDEMMLPKLGDYQPLVWNNGFPSFDREPEVRLHVLPWSYKPHKWEKADYTEEEIKKILRTSELNRHLVDTGFIPPKETPISINESHLALLLGSGELDGTGN